MSSASFALQAAIHQRLTGEAAVTACSAGRASMTTCRAARRSPTSRSASPPSATGAPAASPAASTSSRCTCGRARRAGARPTRSPKPYARALHDSALALTGHRLVNLRHELTDTRRDPDGETYHGIVRLRAVTEPQRRRRVGDRAGVRGAITSECPTETRSMSGLGVAQAHSPRPDLQLHPQPRTQHNGCTERQGPAAQDRRSRHRHVHDGRGAALAHARVQRRDRRHHAPGIGRQWRELLAGAGVRSARVTGAGMFKDAASDEMLRAAFFAGDDQGLPDRDPRLRHGRRARSRSPRSS